MNQEKPHVDLSQELPAPVSQAGPDAFHEQQSSQRIETNTSSPSVQYPSVVQPQSSQQQSSAAPPPGPQPTQASAIGQVATPHIADDENLIEKEWVESAKRIIAQTKQDPHARSDGLNTVKKDYKKKRYNIDTELGNAA